MSWTLFALAVLSTIATTYASSANIALLQHADFLYLPALYNDLILEGGKLKDWALPPSPYFFPDFALYVVLRAISSSQNWTAIATQVLVPTAIALLSTHIAGRIGLPLNSHQTLALLSTMLLAYAWRWSGLAVGVLCLSIHSGQIIIFLACVALLLRQSAGRVAIACLLSFATALSDPLFVMTSMVPLAFLVWCMAHGWARWAKVAALLAANLGGVAVYRRLPVSPHAAKLFDPTRCSQTFHAFAAHLGDFDALPVYIGFGCAALALVTCWRDRQRRTVILALLLSVPSTLVGLWFVGAEVVVWGSRYLILMHVILAILAPIGLNALVKAEAFTWAITGAVGFAAALAVIGLGHNLRNIGKVRLAPMECFDRFNLKHPVHRCVASYWLAKPIAVLATNHTTVIQTGPDGVPYRWINTERHIRDNVNVDCAVFNDADAAYFSKRHGAPQIAEQCEGVRVMMYRGEGQLQLNRSLSRVLR
jgi:hypothetical protein